MSKVLDIADDKVAWALGERIVDIICGQPVRCHFPAGVPTQSAIGGCIAGLVSVGILSGTSEETLLKIVVGSIQASYASKRAEEAQAAAVAKPGGDLS